MKIIYVASPYTHDSQAVRDARFDVVTGYAAALWGAGMGVYSPLTQTHEAARRVALPTEWEFWQAQCRAFLSICSEVHILMLPGWRDSVGVRAELDIARGMSLPVEYVAPGGDSLCRACPDRLRGASPCGVIPCPHLEIGAVA